MKKVLLASTALAGAALMATSATAAPAMVGDNVEVTISGTVRFQIAGNSQKHKDSTKRKWDFASNDSEVKFAAAAAADNGMEYGLQIELNAQTDDTLAADEHWIFVEFENAGRVELGDQDGAADRMFVDGTDATAGRGNGFDGPDGGFNLGGTGVSGINKTSDATKLTYFTPRFAGVQLGASFTPDTGGNGGGARLKNDGNFENVVSAGINYSNSFNDVAVTIAAAGEFGKAEDSLTTVDSFNVVGDKVTKTTTTTTTKREKLRIWGVGGTVGFAGFTVGAGFADLGKSGVDKAKVSNNDAGQWWNVSGKYETGPWAVGVGAHFNSKKVDGEKHTLRKIGAGMTYTIAPGLAAKADITHVNAKAKGKFKDSDGKPKDKNTGFVYAFTIDASF